LLAFFLLLESVVLANARYYLIIDAGSTGSKLHVFRNSGSQLDELTVKHVEVKPGLSGYASNLAGAGPALVPLLDEAKRYVPQNAFADTLMWVKATAGVRVLNATVISAVLAAVEEYFSQPENCPFNFQSAKLLSGEEEASFAFLAVNDLLGNPAKKVGILDLGGASTQVAFEPEGPIGLGEFMVYINRQRQAIYAKSYTLFGLNSATKRYEDALVAAAPAGSTSVDCPCLLEGDTSEGEYVNFTGTSNPAECEKLVKSLMHMDYECLLPPCSLMGNYIPAVVGSFYAMAGFFYTANVLGLVGWTETKVLTPGAILAATRHLCSLDAAKAKQDFLDSKWKYLRTACFNGYHVFYVLQGYGFAMDDTSVTYAREISNKPLGWARGAVLFETEDMPKYLPRLGAGGANLRTWQVMCGILGVATIVLAALAVALVRGNGSRCEGDDDSDLSSCEKHVFKDGEE